MTSWRTFLSTVLPEEGTGYYCIGSYKNKEAKPLTTFVDTIEGAEKAIQEYLDLKRDVYFGISKFITNENRQAKKVELLRKSAREHAQKIEQLSLKVYAKAGESGKLFGTVTAADIADALKSQGFDVDRRKITIEAPIKSLGKYEADAKIFMDITVKVHFEVEAEGSEA